MTDRSFILAPKVISVDFQVHQTYAVLNSLGMLSEVDDYPGVDEGILRIAKDLAPEVKRTNKIFDMVFYSIMFGFDSTLTQFSNYVDSIAAANPNYLQQLALDGFLGDHILDKHPEITRPTREDFLTKPAIAFDYFQALHRDEENSLEFGDSILKEGYHLLQNPYLMQQVMLNHLRYMWETYFQAEWERLFPLVEETVEAFRQLDYLGKSGIEIGRIVTGRDMSNTWVGDYMEKAEQMIFIPALHIGPYVAAFKLADEKLFIAFRPHLPEGVTQKPSAALNRSELLVRLNAIADDSRLRILELFKDHEELCAQDIIQVLDLSQSAASRHLRQLTATGYLIERRKEGAKCYRLNADRVMNTLQALQTFLAIQ